MRRGLIGFGDAHAFLGAPPRTRTRPFLGPEDTLVAMAKIAHGPRGEQSPLVHVFQSWVTRDLAPKDYLSEILAVRNVLVQPSPWRPGHPLFRYQNDPTHVELIKDPQRLVEEINATGSCDGDCDDATLLAATLCLHMGREVELVALGFGTDRELTHVACRVREPKTNAWIWVDPIAGPREAESAARATTKLFHSLH